MYKTILALTLLCFPLQSRAAYIKGQIRDAEPGAKVELYVPHRFIDGQDSRFKTQLDPQGGFVIQAELQEPQMAFLTFNDDRLPLFLSNGDTLSIKADAFQFPLAVTFGAEAGPNNRLLQDFLRKTPFDFNEFNNIRFKIGQYWTSVENAMKDQMEEMLPAQFRTFEDSLRQLSMVLVDKSFEENPGVYSEDFEKWLDAEITYAWAYHLLIYGQIYGNRFAVQPDFFDFTYEAPIIGNAIGSTWYRQFLLAFMARQQTRSGDAEEFFWSGQYQRAGKLLSGKPLAFFRSEVISAGFSAEKFRDLLPFYTDFLQNNEYIAYDAKVEGLYQKYAHVMPGTSAPEFQATDIDGNTISLPSMRGKVVYLNFWATWCGACLRKMELMDGFVPELSAKGIEILNVSVDENTDKWRAALTEHLYKGRHLLSSAGKSGNLSTLYGVEAVPQYFIIGRDGRFADRASSGQPEDIRQQLLRTAGK